MRGKKIDPRSILIKEEEADLVEYMMEMVKVAHPLSIADLKMKVAETCQQRCTHFKDGILGKNWLKWFKKRQFQLIMKIPKGLDLNKARNLCPPMVQSFYENL